MSNVALITGITGQDGSYLAEFLLGKGYDVYGLVRRLSTPNTGRIEQILGDVHLLEGDLTDQSSLNYAMDAAQPDEVYNLAAQLFVATSWTQLVRRARSPAWAQSGSWRLSAGAAGMQGSTCIQQRDVR